MKILIWAPFINKVGTTTNVINSIIALKKFSKKEKYSIDLVDVFGEWNNYDFKNLNINKIKLLNSEFILKGKKNGFLKSRFYMILIFFNSIFPLLKLIKKNKYNYIIAHLITSLPIFLFYFIQTQTKLILSIAGFPKLTFIRSFFWKLSNKNINKILCPSEETKQLLVKQNIFNQDKIFVIKDPHINIKKIISKKNEDNYSSLVLSNKYIISIGRLTRQKNYDFLIKSFYNILKIKKDVNLVIIGEGEDRKKIETKIQELNLTDRVMLLGYQDNIYKYLKKAYCYLSTSIWEGPDLAMLDASFLNIPIICSDCRSGRKEFIDDGKRGYIFKTNNMDSFMVEFKKFIDDDKTVLKNKLINSKKEVKNFTIFRFYLSMKKILD
jgi:glycosyltransferase involved in cell wall biosynthesis